MNGIFDVVVVAKGVHGPFKPTKEELTAEAERLGRELTSDERDAMVREYRYVTLAAQDGSGSSNATYAPDLEWEPELFKPYKLKLEVRNGGKLRLHGEAEAKTLAPARAA